MVLALAVVALVSAPQPQTRSVGRSEEAEPCAVGSETGWRAREPLALFAALQPQEPLFMGSKRVAELRSLDEVDFVTKAGKPTVVMFYAPWCPHCRNTKPVLDKVAERLVNIEFKQIDASGIAEVRGPYGVTAYPTIKYFDSANLEGIKYHWHGANEDDLRGFLERAMVTALSAYQAVALTAAPTADGSQGWTFDDRSFPQKRGPWACPDSHRNADYEECLEAVQQASSKGNLQVKGLKKVNNGETKRVPRGCSYSVEAEMAIYNKNPNGTTTHGRMYRLACIDLSHEALAAAHEEEVGSSAKKATKHASKANKANKANKENTERKGSKQAKSPTNAKGNHGGISGNQEDDVDGHDGTPQPHSDEGEGGPCPGSADGTPHPNTGCHVPGPEPICNEVHKGHPDHDPALCDCDDPDCAGDPWAPNSPPYADGTLMN